MNDSQRLQYVGEQDVILDGTRGRCVCDRDTRSCEGSEAETAQRRTRFTDRPEPPARTGRHQRRGASRRHLVEHRREGGEEGAATALGCGEEGGGGDG